MYKLYTLYLLVTYYNFTYFFVMRFVYNVAIITFVHQFWFRSLIIDVYSIIQWFQPVRVIIKGAAFAIETKNKISAHQYILHVAYVLCKICSYESRIFYFKIKRSHGPKKVDNHWFLLLLEKLLPNCIMEIGFKILRYRYKTTLERNLNFIHTCNFLKKWIFLKIEIIGIHIFMIFWRCNNINLLYQISNVVVQLPHLDHPIYTIGFSNGLNKNESFWYLQSIFRKIEFIDEKFSILIIHFVYSELLIK